VIAVQDLLYSVQPDLPAETFLIMAAG